MSPDADTSDSVTQHCPHPGYATVHVIIIKGCSGDPCDLPVGCQEGSHHFLDEVNSPLLKVLKLLVAAGQQVPLLFLGMPQSMVCLHHTTFSQPGVVLQGPRASASSPFQQCNVELPAGYLS